MAKIAKAIGFDNNPELRDQVDKWAKTNASNKGVTETEFWHEFFQDILAKGIKDDEKTPENVKIHFRSDLSKLSEALNSIRSTFINQMSNISVEKNNWDRKYNDLKNEKEVVISELKGDLINRESFIDQLEKQNAVQNDDLLKKQELINKSDEVRDLKDKEIARLEVELDNAEKHKKEKATEYKENIAKLNEQIVNLNQKLEKYDEIVEKQNNLKQQVFEMSKNNEMLQEKLEASIADKDLTLKRLRDELELEKKNAILDKQQELLEQIQKYVSTIEDLRSERDQLTKQLAKKYELEQKYAELEKKYNDSKK